MIILMILVGGLSLLLGYIFYGRYISKKIGIEPNRETPAHKLRDDIDYLPAKKSVLLGHHFASIAGAAPIIGPITAAVFGWVPVFLWIIIGSIFMGAVHDFASLIASVRHKGQTIGKIIENEIGTRGKDLFLIFSWAALVLVVAVFAVVVAKTFSTNPSAATASVLFIVVAIAFGFIKRKLKTNLIIITIIGVLLLFLSIFLGLHFPIQMGFNTWLIILFGYVFIGSVSPVWVLLKPRDYLNAFILFITILLAVIGIIAFNPQLKAPAYAKFSVEDVGTLFPILFVTVACGAISGFHSLVASGTVAKQLDKESDAKLIGYGSMLIEAALALIALATAIYLTKGEYLQLLNQKGPVTVFSNGIGNFLTSLGIPYQTGSSIIALAVSAFALTSLDTATRLGRYSFQEFFDRSEERESILSNNRYIGTAFTVMAAALLAFTGQWKAIWPIFGSANQLLAAIALLAISVWLLNRNRKAFFTLIPMLFMMVITLSALATLVYKNFKGGENPILAILGVLLFGIAIVLALFSWKKISSIRKEHFHEHS